MLPTTNMQESAAAQQQRARENMQKLILINGEIFEKAAAYDNVIMIGGFAAFYATWSGAVSLLERWAVLWSGVM